MAIFGWKKPGNDGQSAPVGNAPAAAGEGVPHEPDKAAKFFQHARTAHDSTNYEYAMRLWLGGLRFDPASMTGTESFVKSAQAFVSDSGGKKPGKEVSGAISGRSGVDKYLNALLDWAVRPQDPAVGVKAFELAAELNLPEPAFFVGEFVLAAAAQDKKPRKEILVKVMNCFAKIGAFDRALKAGEAAYRLDNTDGTLGAHVRNLAAQATMNQGGYDQSGQAGGFRANIRDAEKQRQLIESERIVKTEEVKDRVLAGAEEEYKKRPDDIPILKRLVQALLERGKSEDEDRALALLSEAHERTHQYAFRAQAGEIRLRRQSRVVSDLRARSEASPDDASLKEQFQVARHDFEQARVAELLAKAEAYPTDLTVKFELGKSFLKLGKQWEAIEQLQEAQNEPKHRAEALGLMAGAFFGVDYLDESIETFRRALETRDLLPALNLELRYGLLTALQKKAETARDLAAAEEADKIASSIAIQQITFKDIRQRRETIKKLVIDLKPKPAT